MDDGATDRGFDGPAATGGLEEILVLPRIDPHAAQGVHDLGLHHRASRLDESDHRGIPTDPAHAVGPGVGLGRLAGPRLVVCTVPTIELKKQFPENVISLRLPVDLHSGSIVLVPSQRLDVCRVRP